MYSGNKEKEHLSCQEEVWEGCIDRQPVCRDLKDNFLFISLSDGQFWGKSVLGRGKKQIKMSFENLRRNKI